MTITCGEATIRLLKKYGVNTVFGIPGVHTLELCRGLYAGENLGEIKHVQARNEQGAGFMAEGWARATGEVGVAIVISGPGVTNASTALGQCYADSLPMLLISAEPNTNTFGKGWGVLHEITEQKKVTEPITAFSATAHKPSDIPDFFEKAFSIFNSQRPRSVHISIPLDVQSQLVAEEWLPVEEIQRPSPNKDLIIKAVEMLKNSKKPFLIVGGGASKAGKNLSILAEMIGAPIISSTAGKGIVSDYNPLHLSGSTVRLEGRDYLAEADVILAVGTELSETDSFTKKLEINGELIRIDIDSSKINDLYPAKLGIVSDAEIAVREIVEKLDGLQNEDRTKEVVSRVQELRQSMKTNLTDPERQHFRLLSILRENTDEDTIFSGDACQLVYTGAFAFNIPKAKQWFYPAGFCALGNALPNGIGAKLACPDSKVVVLAGDGGFMFTMPELLTAVDLAMSLPIIIWENGGLKQIQDDMDAVGFTRVGVEGINPDFVSLAKACHCEGIYVDTKEKFICGLKKAFERPFPTLIIVRENDKWLLET